MDNIPNIIYTDVARNFPFKPISSASMPKSLNVRKCDKSVTKIKKEEKARKASTVLCGSKKRGI